MNDNHRHGDAIQYEKSKSAMSESKHLDTNETRIACNSKGILDDV